MIKRHSNMQGVPKAIGPYSICVEVGDMIFVSGQIPIDAQTGEIVEGGIEAQCEQVMSNLKYVLEGLGKTFEDVVKTTIFMVDLRDFAKVNEIYGRYFGESKPARATVQVSALPKGALIEIEMIVWNGK